jgi:FlaA1/EpsC-like NDP-sugar epimerase
MVRFGNVLGSSGSVIPLFRQQIKDGGPVTVTDVNMIRYFMTIPEAVELVIQAGAMGTGGDVFVLDMGKPVRINDLAKKMIRLSGLEVKDELHPDGDIEIKYTGLRPGEKLYEELLIGDNVSDTDNPRIMRAEEDMLSWDELEPVLDSLKNAIKGCDQKKLRELLVQIVPGFKPQCEITDVLYKAE